MLQRAAPRLGPDELDAVVIAQHAYVVGDDAEGSAELHREVAGARDSLAEPLQDARAQRMSQRFRDPWLPRSPPEVGCPVLPDGVDELVGMVASKRTRQRPDIGHYKSVNAPTHVFVRSTRSRVKPVAGIRSRDLALWAATVFTIVMPKRSAPLTDPPKSDPCRPPARS